MKTGELINERLIVWTNCSFSRKNFERVQMIWLNLKHYRMFKTNLCLSKSIMMDYMCCLKKLKTLKTFLVNVILSNIKVQEDAYAKTWQFSFIWSFFLKLIRTEKRYFAAVAHICSVLLLDEFRFNLNCGWGNIHSLKFLKIWEKLVHTNSMFICFFVFWF